MKIDVCYCAPHGDHHAAAAWRFINSYHQFPPMTPHNVVILTDPGPSPDEFDLFHTLPDVSFFRCDAPGYDLQRYQSYCLTSNADMIVFCGGSTYFRRPGWLVRAASAFERLGRNNLYGSCGHNGAPGVHEHIRTTGFWCSPDLMNRYPYRVTNPSMRYPAEHGDQCLTAWVKQQGARAYVIDWQGEHEWPHYNDSPNGYARGDQSAVLIGDRLTGVPPPCQMFV